MARSITERVKTVLSEQLGVEEAACVEPANLQEGLGADSLDVVEVVMALEEEFEVEVSEEQAEKIATVQDAIDLMTKLAA